MKLSDLIYYIRSSYRWLSRCCYSRGFGIQSPSAYSFVRYVINEHSPYYAYSNLDRMMQSKGLLFRKMGRLYFRLANFWQPHDVVVSCKEIQPYINAACHEANVVDVDSYEFGSASLPILFILNIEYLEDLNFCNRIFNLASDKTLLVVTDIYASKETKALWRSILDEQHSVVTFDLYDCGIVFFDKSKYKQNFKINF